jgi:CubicO group peptidase (beta-lactamase class C family)
MSAAGIPGLAALVVQGDRTLLARGYGVRRLGTREPVTPETLFQIGSLTKAVTATAVATLVGEGTVDWDDPVQEHLPGFRLADPWISAHLTIRDVLAMRSGIESGDTVALFSGNSRGEILDAVGALDAARFRELYGLSPNLMYFLAGEVVAAARGSSWDRAVREMFFAPLGMTHTTTAFAEGEARDNYAWPHVRREGRTVPRTERANADNVAAAAGVISNIVDWGRWVRFNLDDGRWEGRALVDRRALLEMRRPQILLSPAYQGYFNPDALLNAYGFGWVVSEYRGRLLVEHGGTLPGNTSIIALLPEEDIGVVIMSNLGFGPAIPALLALKFRILDDLLDDL